MKVIEEASLDDEESTYYRMTLVMEDGRKLRFCDMCQCAEDNSYWRDHRDVPRMAEFVKAAYQAGVDGEKLEIQSV